jgi:hypothetical protein
MRADALFVDPFARLLAGPKAMARHQVGVRGRGTRWLLGAGAAAVGVMSRGSSSGSEGQGQGHQVGVRGRGDACERGF